MLVIEIIPEVIFVVPDVCKVVTAIGPSSVNQDSVKLVHKLALCKQGVHAFRVGVFSFFLFFHFADLLKGLSQLFVLGHSDRVVLA